MEDLFSLQSSEDDFLQDLQDLGASLANTTPVQQIPLHNIPVIDPRPHEDGIPNTITLVELLLYTVNLSAS